MLCIRSFAVVVVLSAVLPLQAMAETGVGTLKTLAGTAHLTHAGAAQAMKEGDTVGIDDVVETEAGSRAVFSFADGAELVMTGKGKLVIDEYVYDPAKMAGNKAVLDVLDAAFSYTGGAMDKAAKPEVKLNLDYGTIGIRGTKLIGARRNGITWVYLSEGGAVFENAGGKTDIAPGYGTRIRSKADAPAPAYPWGAEEVAWLQRFVDDAGAHETPAMASNMSSKNIAQEQLQAENMPALSAPASPAEPTVGGGAQGNEMSARSRAADSAPAAEAPAAKAKQSVRADAQPEIALVRASAAGKDGLIAEEAANTLRVTTGQPAIVPLAAADAETSRLQNTPLRYTAELNAQALDGTAHLEVHVLLSGRKTGYVFGRDTQDTAVTPADGWKTVTGSFNLKPEDVPDQIKIGLVVDGKGSVLVRNLRLVRE